MQPSLPSEAEHEWLELLHDLMRGDPEQDLESMLAGMLKDFLLSDDGDAPATFARRFDDLYSSVYEPRFNGYLGRKKGWTGYLITFYSVVVPVAMDIPYHDPKQDKVIQLLVELRKLPVRRVKIFVQPEFEWVDSETWNCDPLLPWELLGAEPCDTLDMDNYNHQDAEDVQEFEQDSAFWVNAYSFHARCTAAGLDEGFKFRFTMAGQVISIGLEPGFPSDKIPKLDSHVMAAAQYILLAGDVMHAECVRNQLAPHRHHDWRGWANGNGPVVWKEWATRLSEIADALEGRGALGFKLFEKNREALRTMIIKARDKMVALEPELFASA